MNTRRFAEGERVKEERRPPEPAPLPSHVLLRLQQSAGNQAVGRVLARNKIKTPAAKAAVTGATKSKPKPTNATELLLALYNKLGTGHGGPWAKVSDAVDALTTAQVIDAGDATYFQNAADTTFPTVSAGAKKKQSATDQLKSEIEADRGAIMAEMGDHILLGAWRTDNRPSGYHTKKGDSTTHEGFGKVTKGEYGTYQQSVREKDDPKNVKEHQSTFFPDKAGKDDVIDAVTSVYGESAKKKGRSSVAYPDTLKGIPLTRSARAPRSRTRSSRNTASATTRSTSPRSTSVLIRKFAGAYRTPRRA